MHPQAFLVNDLMRNLQENWSRVSMVFLHTSRRAGTAKYVKGPSRKLWCLHDSRSKFSVKNLNLETITGMESRYKIWLLNGCNHIRAKPNLLRRERRVYESFSSPQTSRMWFTLTIPRSLAKIVKSVRGIIEHPRLTVPRQMVLRKERSAESRKELLQYCCNPAWRKNGERIPWNVSVIFETFTTAHPTGKHFMNGALENHSQGP